MYFSIRTKFFFFDLLLGERSGQHHLSVRKITVQVLLEAIHKRVRHAEVVEKQLSLICEWQLSCDQPGAFWAGVSGCVGSGLALPLISARPLLLRSCGHISETQTVPNNLDNGMRCTHWVCLWWHAAGRGCYIGGQAAYSEGLQWAGEVCWQKL